MFYYEGLTCPVCETVFKEGDDVVVCPRCGLPHHRRCWAEIGKCYADDKHGTEEQWSREEAECDKKDEAAHHEVVTQPLPPVRFAAEAYSSNEKIGSTNAADLAAVVGSNTRYYLERFRRIERGQSGGWNWAAFLLAPFWLFYRKQYKLGALYLVLRLLSSIVTTVIFAPIQMAQTAEAMEAALLSLAATPQYWITCLLSLTILAMEILLGLRANAFYLQHCENKIHAARARTPDISTMELASQGGVSWLLPVLCYVVCNLITSLASMLILMI